MRSRGIKMLTTFVLICVLNLVSGQNQGCKRPKATEKSADLIFDKYGNAAGGDKVIDKTGLNNLLESLSLNNLKTVCEPDDIECQKDEVHLFSEGSDPLQKRKRRSASDDNTPVRNLTHDSNVISQREKCVKMNQTILSTFSITDSGMTKDEFFNVSPFLIEKVASKSCIHYHKRYPEFHPPEEPPTSAEKWGYGVAAVTICSMLSLCVIAMIPCLQKSFYDKMMAFLVALAVGTLCGDALLHLIPHAFIEGANMAAGITVSEEQAEAQHLSQVYRALLVMAGIYLFFIVEQLMKIKASRGKPHAHENDKEIMEVDNHIDETPSALIEEGNHAHGPENHHGHSHGNKDITGKTNISTVAWMVVVGDGFHNFSDGLAVGAAFSASISSGVSTTIAIFCHELPHELGDFAVLIKAGMTIKQAIVYNLVGAILSYVGLAIGILAGTGELGRHVILCLTAGLFLYISLVNMMTEVSGSEADVQNCATVICQHLGMLTGIGIMLVISIYEHDM